MQCALQKGPGFVTQIYKDTDRQIQTDTDIYMYVSGTGDILVYSMQVYNLEWLVPTSRVAEEYSVASSVLLGF